MSKFKKIVAIIIVILVFPLIFFIANFFILQSSSKIYSYIPQDADIVIEINTKNIIKEIAYQRIYNYDYFTSKIPEKTQKNTLDDLELNSGIDIFSNMIIFRETWAKNKIWFAIVKYTNSKNINNFCEKNGILNKPFFNDSYAIIQLTEFTNQQKVNDHLNKVIANKIKSFNAKIDLTKKFNPKNEINIYVAPKKSKHIIEGFLAINFLADKIIINGNITPVGKNDNLDFINYETNKNSALTLRSSLNLFNSVYLLNNKKIHDIPDYDQLALDIDGTTLLMTNAEIPLVALPHVNLQISSKDSLTWHKYIHSFDESQGISIDTFNHNILIDADGKAKINYNSTATNFSVFQNSNSFIKNKSNNTYFDLKIKPNLFIEHTVFEEDTLNPPKMAAKLKIGIVQGMMQNMDYLDEVEYVDFTIKKNDNNTDLISKGCVKYSNKEGHSIIESISILNALAHTLGSLIE